MQNWSSHSVRSAFRSSKINVHGLVGPKQRTVMVTHTEWHNIFFFLCYGLAHSCHNSTIVVFLPEVLLCICPESCPQREPRGCAAAVHTVPSSARGCSKAGSTHLLEREVWGRSVAATTQTPWSYRTWRWHQSSSLTAYNHIADTSPL